MEQHDVDPTTEDRSTASDPWDEASDRWASLAAKLRDRYQDLVGPDGPTEQEVREALGVLGSAGRSLAGSVATAMKDPDVRRQVRDATASLVSALGNTFDQLGDELRDLPEDDGEAGPDPS